MGYQKKQKEHPLLPEQLEQMDSPRLSYLAGFLFAPQVDEPDTSIWMQPDLKVLFQESICFFCFFAHAISESDLAENIWATVCFSSEPVPPKGHLLDALVLDHKLLFADCFHKYWSLRSRLTYKLFFWILLISRTIFRSSCQITIKKDFLK